MPQFAKQTSRPLSPVSIRASAKRGRKLIELVERYADPQNAHEKASLTRAIHGLSLWARSLSQRHRQVSVAQEMAMLPNDHHPGPRCSCRDCLDRYNPPHTADAYDAEVSE